MAELDHRPKIILATAQAVLRHSQRNASGTNAFIRDFAARRGVALTVIERSLAHELDGTSRLDFTPDGMRCTLRLPAAHLGAAG